MPTQKTMAQRAVDKPKCASQASRETFLELMRGYALPCVLFRFGEGSMSADYVLYEDGSGFFAELEENGKSSRYYPWPLDDYLPNGQAGEMLAVLARAAEIANFQENAYQEVDHAVGDFPEIDAHLRSCVLAHGNPPEAMRELILDNKQEFHWTDQGGAQQAQTMLVLICQYLLPSASQIIIRGNAVEGVSEVEKAENLRSISMMKEFGTSTSYEKSMECHYRREAYAEIDEVRSEVDGDRLLAANEVLAVISTAILSKFGRPVGWEVDYNDGARNRMSGFSAYQQTIAIGVESLSNHHKLDIPRTLSGFLAQNDLLKSFQALLKEHGFKRLPTPVKVD